MITTLVLDKNEVDQGLLDNVVSPDLKNGKKDSFTRKDESVCEYYIIDTRVVLNPQDENVNKFNVLMLKARTQGYNYVMFK